MDRQRRASEEENPLWRDPCGYNNTNFNSGGAYKARTAKMVAQQAKLTAQQAAAYKKLVASLHSFDSFEELLKEFKDEWLNSLVNEKVLPESKNVFEPVDEENVQNIKAMMGSIDTHLPVMYKALKMIVGSLHRASESLIGDGISVDQDLADKLSHTMKDVRAVLCYFYDLMKSRNLPIEEVLDKHLPDINKDNKEAMALYIYRDTINYLEYIDQVFTIMSETLKESHDESEK